MKPVPFLKNFDEAMSLAQREGKRLLVDFETTWCGPCKQMDQWGYTAKPVAEAAANLIAVKIDGDERRELVKRFNVSAYPTLILLDATGAEVRRSVGYLGVQGVVNLLKN